MGKYNAYEKYKDSGVEWLGEIPEHWKKLSLRWLIQINSGDFISNLDTKVEMTSEAYIPVVGGNGIMSFTDKENTNANSIILGRVGAHCGNVHLFKERIWVTDNALRITLKSKYLDSIFLFWLLKSLNLNNSANKNAQPLITGEMVKNRSVAIPPLPEQQTIANFLDYKTKQIDALIAKKETLLEKLDEKRTAIISHAVTKGLDPNVPMKDSGIEWLGEIPEHWEVIKVKYLTKILRGKFTHRPRNDPKLYDGQYPFIQTGDVAKANKFITEYTQTLNEDGYAVSKEFPSGTLVMTISANIGDMAILNFNACFPDSIVGFVPSKRTEIFFLYYLFTSMKKEFLSTAVLNTQLNLNVERISHIFTVIPPLEEQTKIIYILDKTLIKIDQQKAKIQQAIDRLKEYRTALITNAVTGKIDVRQVTIP